MIGLASLMAPLGYAVHRYLFLAGGPQSARLGSTLSRFGIDFERSVPTWFSATLLVMAAGAVGLCFRWEREHRHRKQYFWLGLMLLLVTMSIDEVAGFHENFSYIVLRYTGYQGSGAFRYRWVLVGIPLVFAVGMVFVPFLLRVRRRTALLLCVSGAIYFGGSVGLEMVASHLRDIHDGVKTAGYHLVTAIEEYFEMVGASLACYTALEYLRAVRPKKAVPKPRAYRMPDAQDHHERVGGYTHAPQSPRADL